MKIISTRNNLRDAFQLAERFTGKNLTLPVLGNILLSADEKGARVAATNLEIGVETALPGKIIKTGAVTIPAKIVHSLLQALEDDSVTIEEKDAVVTIKTDSSTFSVQGMGSADFPQLPKVKKENEFVVPAHILKSTLSSVVSSVSLSDFKPELSGVFCKRDLHALTAAATDSFRLAEKTVPLASSGNMFSFILPGRTAQELIRSLPEDGSDVTVREGEHQILFSFGDTVIVSRLVDGAYPDYTAIIPKDFDTHIVSAREECVRKIKAASTLSSKLNDITIRWNTDSMTFEAANAELGKSEIQFSGKAKGKTGRVSFNYRYLLDGLEALGASEATISLNGDSSPAMIQSPEDPAFRYVIMPIRNV